MRYPEKRVGRLGSASIWACGLGLCLLAVLVAPTAHADPSIDVATRASEINQQECANVHTLKHRVSAAGMQKVVEVWDEVLRVYEEEGKAPYLLFWRGVLAQCLGRNELAVLDFESFVASQRGQSMFTDLVRQSRTRLKRLGAGRKLGQGPAAKWLRNQDIVEIGFSYGLATGVRGFGCTDEEDAARNVAVVNSTCIDGQQLRTNLGDVQVQPQQGVAPPFWPVGMRVGAQVHPIPRLSLGGIVQLDSALHSEQAEHHAPGPVLQLFVGPQVRLGSGVHSGGRATELRIAARFAAAWGPGIPWAGYKDPVSLGVLDAGSVLMRHVGFQAELGGRFEVGPAVVLKLSGELAYYFDGEPESASPLALGEPVEVDWSEGQGSLVVEERVVRMPALVRTSRLYAGFRGSLLRPHKKLNLGMGPFFELGFHRTHLVYPNHEADLWQAGTEILTRMDGAGKPQPELLDYIDEKGGGDQLDRKVYSTLRRSLLFRFGIELQFGLGAHQPKGS